MKGKNILALAILIVGLIIPSMVMAQSIEGTLAFGLLLEEGNSFSLNIAEQQIRIGNIQSTELLFANNDVVQGFFYVKNGSIRTVPGEFSFISPVINNIQYDLVHFEALGDYLSEEEMEELGVEDQGFFMLGNEFKGNAMTVGDYDVNAFLLPDDGSKLIISDNGGFVSVELPASLMFNAREENDEEVMGQASGETEVQNGETGCIDHDDEQNNDENQLIDNLSGENNFASYVTHIYEKDGNLKILTAPDFCAEETIEGNIITRLYEADCDANGNPVYTEVECNCRSGRCLNGDGKVPRFCVDTDPLVYSVEGEEQDRRNQGIDMDKSVAKTPAEGFADTFGLKGNTVGYYATIDGKEYGLWEDYCSDEHTLVEYHCANEETAMFRTIVCPNGCNQGKCLEAPYCFETDGGNTTQYRGRLRAVDTEGNFSDLIDSCVDSNTITEYYCDATNMELGFTSSEISCGEGNMCNDGKCSPIETCETDEDCTGKQVCIANICQEVQCFNDSDCGEGFSCESNECVEQETLSECSACLDDRPFHMMQWQGESCNINDNMVEMQILKCSKGTYCTNNNNLSTQCSTEPLESWGQIYEAFNRRFIWAEWLLNYLGDIIVEGGSDEEIQIWGDGLIIESEMDAAAQIVNHIDQTINIESGLSGFDFSEAEENEPANNALDNRETNMPCANDNQCASGNCVVVNPEGDKMCMPAEDEDQGAPYDSPCVNDADCASNYCHPVSNTCKPNDGSYETEIYAARGSTCRIDQDCDENEQCLNTFCAPITCSGPLDCSGFACDAGICDLCSSDDDCATGNCNLEFISTMEVQGMCLA